MQKNKNGFIQKYFAAANSYNGFICLFDQIFTPEDFHMIYVLKGGPGTGKSSLMKKISKEFTESGYRIEEIYCSSDPHSLDGVIIEKNNKKIAIIDGTSPHERDAKNPLAADKIINLADNLDERILLPQKGAILSLATEKAKAYKTAYFYLSCAGRFDSLIEECYTSNFDKTKAKVKAESFLQDIPTSQDERITTRFISSFGRLGERRIEPITDHNFKVIRVGGNEYSVGLLLEVFKDFLVCKKQNLCLFPSALNPRHLDGILLPDYSLMIVKSDDFEIDADEFMNIPPIEYEEIRSAKMLRIDSLDEARRWFAIASDIHFRLENIYTSAMDFEKNDNICSRITEEIISIMEKEI